MGDHAAPEARSENHDHAQRGSRVEHTPNRNDMADNTEDTTEKAEAKVPEVQEPNPYYNALLSIVAVVQATGACDDATLQACLESEGIGEFYSYARILLEAANFEETEEDDEDPAYPEQENDEDASDEDENFDE